MFPYQSQLVGIEQGAKQSSEDAELVVATYQSLHSKERYRKFDPAHFKCIIVDEVESVGLITSDHKIRIKHLLFSNTNLGSSCALDIVPANPFLLQSTS